MQTDHKYSFTEHFLFPSFSISEKKLRARVQNKTVLITGASFGIGECLAYKLAAAGANLILVARTEEKLLDIKHDIEQLGGKVTVFPTDLTKPEQVHLLSGYLLLLPDGVDIVINNAGKSIRRSINDSLDRYHDFTRTMGVNYFGPVQLMLDLIPILRKTNGHIVNVSAVNVLLAPAPLWSAYQASKSAFDNWFRCATPELNLSGIKTSSVYLPLVRTRMIAPTAAYDKMPTMSPDHAANIICRCLITNSRKYAPWWLIFGQLASVLFGGLWVSLSTHYLKKRNPIC